MKQVILTLLYIGASVGLFAQGTCYIYGPSSGCTNIPIEFTTGCPGNGLWLVSGPGGTQFVSGSSLLHSFTLTGTYTIDYDYYYEHCVPEPDNPGSYICNTLTASAQQFTVVIHQSPQVPVIQSDKLFICTPSQVNMTIANPEGGVSYSWSSNPGGYSGTGPNVTFNNVAQTTLFTVVASTAYCSMVSTKNVHVEQTLAYPVMASFMPYHKRVIEPSQPANAHYWQISTTGTEVVHPATGPRTVTEPGNFYIRSYSEPGNCWAPATGPVTVTINYTPPQAVIYMVPKPGYTEAVFQHPDKNHILTFADYFWVQDNSPNPHILKAYNQGTLITGSRLLESGTYYLKGKDRGTGTWGETLTLTVQLRTDNDFNWIHTKSFDGSPLNQPVAESKSYFDEAGKPLQSQSKNFTQNFIFATQNLTDKFDRVVGSTLPAPIKPKEFTYNAAFLVDAQGNPYDHLDFDYVNPDNPAENTRYNPNEAGDTQEGTVGWYYSSNNTLEPYVGKTNFPYSRIEFYEDGTGEVKRAASPGDHHRLGMGHETLTGTFPVFSELTDYLNLRPQAIAGITQDGSLWNEGVQTVSRDENGKYAVSIADKSGKTVMTARKGTANQHTLQISNTVTANANPASPNYRKMVYFYILDSQPVNISITGAQANTLYGGIITKSSFDPAKNTYVASKGIKLLPGFKVPQGSTFKGRISAPADGYVVENLVTGERLDPYGTFADESGNWPAGFYRITLLSGEITVSWTNYFTDVSYQFYNDAGRLVSSLSPNGFAALKGTNPPGYSAADQTTYKYNHRGWLLEMTEPDAGTTRYLYRKDGKIRYSQNAEQAAGNKDDFSYTRYDQLGRPVESGEYIGTGYNFSSTSLAATLEFTDQVIFNSADVKDWIKTYYDYPDPFFYSLTGLPSTYVQGYVRGAVSFTENENIKTWYSYDELGRVTWMTQKPKALNKTFVITYTYDFLGNVLTTASLAYQAGQLISQFYHHYEYDNDKRLSTAFTSLDGSSKKLRAKYYYYLHGPLKRIELGGHAQGIDFVYNIHGWLTHINHPDPQRDPGKDGLSNSPNSNFRKDAFSMVLDYYESEMEGLFPTAINTHDLLKPETFHQLPELTPQQPLWLQRPGAAFKPTGNPWGDNMKMIREYFALKDIKDHRGHVARVDLPSPEAERALVADVNLTIDKETLMASRSPEIIVAAPYMPLPSGGYDMVWKYAGGVTVSGNTLTKTAANGWGTGGASSSYVLPPFTDGWIEMTVPSETGKEKMFGFADHDIDLNFSSIDYAFYIGSTSILIYENGTNKGTIPGAPVAGEVLRLERIGPVMYYKRNGNVVYTSSVLSTSHLVADAAINQNNGRITGARCSFNTTEVVFPVDWRDVVGATGSGNTLTKTAGTGWGNAGAIAINQLAANRDGWVEFTVDALNKQRAFGFSDVNTDAHYNTIDYAFYTSGTNAHVTFNGAIQATTPVSINDVLRIERSGTSILFKKNGVTVHTITSGLTTLLLADAAIYDAGATITNARASFFIPASEGFVPDLWELKALKDLYDSLGGATWTTKTNWPASGSWPAFATAATLGTWHGITASGGDLVYVQLNNNNLTGKLPASVGKLTMLTRLEMHTNKLSGSLTPALGDLIRMKTLFFQNNDMTGAVPVALGNLKELTELDLRNNIFTGTFPQFLNQFTKIKWLYVGDNRGSGFTGTIPDLTGLTAVTHIIIRNNPNLSPSPLPAWLGNLPTLVSVLMSNNKFTQGLPESWRNLTNLVTIDISNNSITLLPEWLGDWVNVESIAMRTAGLTGQIPASIGLLSKLKYLYLDNNQLTGSLPPLLNNATKLIYLYVNNNLLSGPLPDLGQLVNLEYVQLQYNQFTGPVGAWIGNLVKLRTLQCSYNAFTYVAPEILSIPTLTNVNFIGNNLESVPNFHTYSNKANLNLYLTSNYLDFSDLEPLFGTGAHGIKTFQYAPQKKFNTVTIKHVPTGNTLQLDAQPKGQYSTVTWEKLIGSTWTNINASNEDATLQTYRLANVTTSINGSYRWRMTNTRVMGLTLESDPIEVQAVDALPAQPGGGALFNGLITAMRWRTESPAAEGITGQDLSGMYQFKYDDKYQILEANWAEPNHVLNTYTLAGNKYRITNMAYDPNGNIKTLSRYDDAGNRIHNFAYAYQANTNKLTGIPGYTNLYTYNAIGQMTAEDKVEAGNDQYVEYDVTGKVRKVYSDAAKTQPKVEYMYDDRGFRLAKVSFGSNVKTTWYIRDASGNILSIYEQQGAPALSNNSPLVQTEVPLYGSGKLGTCYPQQDGSTVYELTDHLGNVRALVRDNITVYTATMEDTEQPDLTNPRVEEMQYFQNLFETTVDDWRFNHTKPLPGIVDQPDKAAYLYWINGAGNEYKAIGPAIALRVHAGDTLRAEVWARYERKVTYSRSIATTAALATLLGGTFAYTGGFEGFTASQTTNSLNNALTAGGFMADGADNTRPFAYLNYILYDRNMVFKNAGWVRVTDAAGFYPGQEMAYHPVTGQQLFPDVSFEHVQFTGPVPVQHDGYVYIWLSNESENTKVWFDDLRVTHTQTRVTRAADYGVWGEVLRETKSDEITYRYGYQGQFAEKDEETGWNHFELREYDPIVARWMSKDQARQFWSPYVGMGNNPINGVDPDGAFKTEFGAKWYAFWHGGGDVEQALGGANKGEWYVGNHVDYKGEGVGVAYQRTFDYGNGNKSFGEHVWNHPLTRYYIPDYVGISFFNVQGVAGVGGSIDFDLMWTLRGNEASWKPLIAATPSLGVGAEVGFTVGVNAYSYLGDAHDIQRGFLETNSFTRDNPTVGGYASVSIPVIKGGISVTLSPAGKSYLVGRQYNIGLGTGGGSVGVFNTFILHDFYKK